MSQEIFSLIQDLSLSPDHQPVLLSEVIEAFLPLREKKTLRYFDGTFGRGGHYQVLKKIFPQMKSVVMDQDLEAEKYAQENFATEVQSGDLIFFRQNFSQFSEKNLGSFDMILLDLGVSSPQLDQGSRGFSFYHHGPLDMRMNQKQELTADFVINTFSEKDLIELFQEYGEIPRPHRVVRAVVHDRKTKAFTQTHELAGLIERVEGWKKKGIHPATKYFMALRLVVNRELEVLDESLPDFQKALNPGGRLSVISFHSLEDRLVKNHFRGNSELGLPVYKKVIVATDEEAEKNPRSRSAKLRVFERRVQDELNFDSRIEEST